MLPIGGLCEGWIMQSKHAPGRFASVLVGKLKDCSGLQPVLLAAAGGPAVAAATLLLLLLAAAAAAQII